MIGFAQYVTERIRSDLVGHAFRVLGDRPDAEDAVQRALVKMWMHWPADDEPLKMRRWMWRVLENECIDEYRRRRSRGASPLFEGDRVRVIADKLPTPEQAFILAEEVAARWAELDALPAWHRAMLMRFEECGSVLATAAALGVPKGTVQSRIFRARAALRRMAA